MVGSTYGHLTVEEMLPNYIGNKKMYCRCRCECGNEKIIESYSLRRSKTASCGCMTGYHRSVWQIDDSDIGTTYNYLTIISVERTGRRPIARCRCVCGNIVTVAKSDVVTGHTKSCGCYHAKRMSESITKDFTGMKSSSGVELLRPARQRKTGAWYWVCKCPLCGGEFETIPAKVLSNHTTSCGCKLRSSWERIIKNYLQENCIPFREQVRFDDCKYKYKLSFDFGVYDSNGGLLFLIEYDGQQHTGAIDFFGGSEAYKETKIRDNIKTQYCKDKNIKLLRIRHDLSEDEVKQLITNTIYP